MCTGMLCWYCIRAGDLPFSLSSCCSHKQSNVQIYKIKLPCLNQILFFMNKWVKKTPSAKIFHWTIKALWMLAYRTFPIDFWKLRITTWRMSCEVHLAKECTLPKPYPRTVRWKWMEQHANFYTTHWYRHFFVFLPFFSHEIPGNFTFSNVYLIQCLEN